MILPDVNVLIYAFRQDVPEHAICRPWLEDIVSRDTPFGLSTLALSALVRVTTNPRLQPAPSPTEEAIAFCDYLLAQPHCQTVEPGERHWDIFRRICAEANVRGPLVTDAWFAALAIEWDCEWITFDRDFARFPGLRWRLPEAP